MYLVQFIIYVSKYVQSKSIQIYNTKKGKIWKTSHDRGDTNHDINIGALYKRHYFKYGKGGKKLRDYLPQIQPTIFSF